MTVLPITTEYIKLQDLMKLADLVSTGGEAKLRILNEEVTVCLLYTSPSPRDTR